MTLDELLYAVIFEIAEHGKDTEVTLGAGFDKNGHLSHLSLQSEPSDGLANILFEDHYLGDVAVLVKEDVA
jgi:hypothetical protein